MASKKRKSSAVKSMFMARYRGRAKPGARPGAIEIPDGALPPHIRLIGYGPDQITVLEDCSLEEVCQQRGKHSVLWIDIAGLGDAAVIEGFGKLFGIHRLALEDLCHIPQRSKVEHYQDYLFVVTQLPRKLENPQNERDGTQGIEQISFFVGEGFVISWRERRGTCFNAVRDRLQVDQSVIRGSGSDYLLYALLDAIIDSYFPKLEQISDKLDDLDEQLEAGSATGVISQLHGVRHDVRLLRRISWPMREAVDSLRSEHDWLFTEETKIYLRDCNDHVAQIIETLEGCREACSDLRDYHATEISNRMNEIMKVLTIIATIFIPLSFIAGVYGMNFDPEVSTMNMPELKWRGGYVFALALMGVVAAGQLFFFRWMGWLGGSSSSKKSKREA